MTRILRVFHSAVVSEYRERERQLRARHGYDVHLVTPPAWPEGGSVVSASDDSDVPMHVVRTRGPFHPILFRYDVAELRRVVRLVRPHLVDVHEEPYSLAAWSVLRAVAREAPGIPVCIYTAQNIHKRYPLPFRLLEWRALRRAAAAYPCSTEAGEVLRRKGFAGRVHVLPLGVSAPAPRRPVNGAVRVGFVGRLVPEKGAELALSAFARAGREDTVLELVGSGPEEPRLRRLAGDLRLGDRVDFAGAVSQDEALRRIGSYDVLLVPSVSNASWKEQFGRVAAQAMVAGTPVLAADSGSLAEVLDGCGELFREGDVDDLSARLVALLDDPARREQLAAAGRRRAGESLTWERVADGFHELYQEALGA